ncbi:D-alanyl-D-alanine carboxypeptidase [Paenibacillus phyllosphaerae]|uniref:D-alanyl-D-alanine carboxypeptidase n=1 Tax=Paenibacillus phyllosphaerae TaxID=274593 RepID=A0A7W5B0D5_9BACL|nr:M15 family metallopeptidase [Paenibacillus phyllosphaerae]MBB3112043.1 D-alanyl-D-alanine carboxypeptidase [Paenibacillus phyllosphaerae]
MNFRQSRKLIAALLIGASLTTAATYPAAHAASASSSFLYSNAASRTITKSTSGANIVINKLSTLVLVNKTRNLPSNYVPADLVKVNVPFSFSGDSPKKQMRKIAAEALEKLFAAAKKDGISIKAVSGYRSYATQKAIFDRNVKLKGEKVANQTSARPGQSEHQTGLAMDISSASVNYELEQSFGDTKEGKWLAKNAPKYGFIIHYGKGLEKQTGYSYEPWHVRYVGVYMASVITASNQSLDTFLAQQ